MLEVRPRCRYNQPNYRNLKMNGYKMGRVKSLLFTACAAFCLFTGCAKQQQFEAVERICVTDTGKLEAMQAAEEVLGKMLFTIAKTDTESGFIKTRPLSGAQFFEFWRKDNVGAFNFSEANLHSIRRIVELDISQQGGQLCISCNVNIERLHLPEHEVSSTSRAYEMFSASSSLKQRLALNPEQKSGMAWVDLGKDARLETRILKRLKDKITKLQKEKRL